MSSLCKHLGIECTQTTAYQPQGNGQVERFNRTLEEMLSKLVKENQRDCDLHIPKAFLHTEQLSMNLHAGYSPLSSQFWPITKPSSGCHARHSSITGEGEEKRFQSL